MIPAECIGLPKWFHEEIQTEMNSDWRTVYKDKRRRPVYVIENGNSPIKLRPGRRPELSVKLYSESSPICNEFLKQRGSL